MPTPAANTAGPLCFMRAFFGKRICGGRPFWKVTLRRQVGRQILPKNIPKTFQNLSKIVPKRRLGMVLSDLGASGGDLGASWTSWGRLAGRLGAVLAASWGRLGGLGGLLSV